MNTELIELLSKVAVGDQRAFEKLYQQTAERILGVLTRLIQNREIAEECLQEAFIQIWRRAADYDSSKGQPLTWMTAIARYRALDRLRKTPRETHDTELAEAAESDWQLSDLSPAESTALNGCLADLEPTARQAIVMSYVEGYSHGELEQHFSTPLGTIKSWIRRGVQALKKCLGPVMGGDYA